MFLKKNFAACNEYISSSSSLVILWEVFDQVPEIYDLRHLILITKIDVNYIGAFEKKSVETVLCFLTNFPCIFSFN